MNNELKITLTIKETAKFLGKTEQYVRIGLQRKSLPFGSAVQTREPTKTRPRGSWDYHIPRIQVERYMGCSYARFLKGVGNEKN